jgi:flavin reductase (DIM6/NTAB) family NADH-FMN oxidoreductase RutF
MTKIFTKINPESIADNPFKLMEKDWTLVTAGSIDSFNTMTAAWGGFGILWHRQVAFIYVRPTRHTFQFMESADRFTLTFFNEEHRSILNFCGKRSGRDTDKIKETGLIPVLSQHGAIYFEQARLVLDCKKIYYQDVIPSNFLDERIHTEYPLKDYHRLYIGEIVECLIG